MKPTKFITSFLLCFLFLQLQAQESINPSGGEASGTGGSATYSVGQVFYSTNNGTTGSVSQGVQQAFEISVHTAIEETSGITLLASAYPNPTTDYLILTVDGVFPNTYTAKLFDINGKIVGSKKVTQAETKIDMRELIQAVYFLKIIHDDKELKTFKIIKK
jgi:hypothetical protein